MSWYDNEKGDVSGAYRNILAVSGTNGLKEFGDAFKDIGIAMQNDNINDRKKKLLDNQLKEQEQKNIDDRYSVKAKTLNNKDAFESYKLEEQNKLDNKYQNDKKEYDDRTISKLWTDEPKKETINISSKEQDDINTYFKTKFNDEAKTVAFSGNYKDFDEFYNANPDLVTGMNGDVGFEIKEQLNRNKPKKTNDIINYEYGKDNPNFKESITIATPFEKSLKYLVNKGKIDQEQSDDLLLQFATAKTQPNMTALAKDIETADTQTNKFIKYLNIDGTDKYNLASIDVRDFTKEQKGQAEQLANVYIRAFKPAGKERIAKEMSDISVMQSQLEDSVTSTIKHINQGKDFNLLDKTKREYFTKYFGMDDQDVTTAFRDSRFQSAMNNQLKLMSGTAVSGQEWDRFKQSIGTLYQTNKSLVNGMLSMVKDQKSKMASMQQSMGSTAFNLKYGGTYANMEDLEALLIAQKQNSKNITKTKKDDLIKLQTTKTIKQPKEQAYQDGTTIFNKSTNQRMIMKGGLWQTIK